MITNKIKALFQFIEFLHSNIEHFNQYNDLIKELANLKNERRKLKPRNNYKDKQKYNTVQAEIEGKFKELQDNTANLIKAKAIELNVCNFENEPDYSFNGIEGDIHQLKENFSEKDLPEIFKHKSQYIKYRSNTHGTFLSLQFFFNELDEIAKSLFDYFKDTEQNEFEAFETKTIEVNSITEMAEIISGKHRLNIEIDKNLSITEKLDYWKSVIDKHFNEPLTEQFGEYEFTFEQEQAKRKQLVKLFGENHKLRTPLLIPDDIFNEHFVDVLNEPEFTYWFLKYNAKTFFEVEIKKKHLPEKLKSDIKEITIQRELKKLNDFEQKAEQLYIESKFNIDEYYTHSEYAKEIEFIRIKYGYYKTHVLPLCITGCLTSQLYAEHIYLKEFLESELNKALLPQQIAKQKPEPKETELSERIKKHFGFFNRNCPRKHKQILNDTDFNKLIEWTIWYFKNDFKVPEISEPIKVVNTNKTFVQLSFKYLFKELHKSSPYPETLFEFYRSAFYSYSEDKKSNFEAVQNKDEVKKLMLIDY